MKLRKFDGILVLCALMFAHAQAQTPMDSKVLKGLSPVTVLLKTDSGKAALAANYTVTGGIQTGSLSQPTLLPFPLQQQQALRDAFIGSNNLSQLADGLGTTLGSAYVARFHNIDEYKTSKLPESIAEVIGYANAVTAAHSNQGKFLFANETTEGKTPVSSDAAAILKEIGGTEDIFGKAYGLAAGSAGADAYGDSRPFQTESSVTHFAGPDYFNNPSSNDVYNRGPVANLINSPSYPSGHTTYGYTGAVLLAILVPERYEQMIVRGAEYGNDRVIMGAHYVMDVMGGRTLALYDMAHLLANDPAYMGLSVRGATPLKDFQAAVRKAHAELESVLQAGCGDKVAICANEDIGRFSNPAANETFYDATQTYNLPVVYPSAASGVEDVATVAPEAGYLLTIAFPSLTLDQADKILTETEGPGGGFLDYGLSSFGVYSRLNLAVAAHRAAQLASGR